MGRRCQATGLKPVVTILVIPTGFIISITEKSFLNRNFKFLLIGSRSGKVNLIEDNGVFLENFNIQILINDKLNLL